MLSGGLGKIVKLAAALDEWFEGVLADRPQGPHEFDELDNGGGADGAEPVGFNGGSGGTDIPGAFAEMDRRSASPGDRFAGLAGKRELEIELQSFPPTRRVLDVDARTFEGGDAPKSEFRTGTKPGRIARVVGKQFGRKLRRTGAAVQLFNWLKMAPASTPEELPRFDTLKLAVRKSN